jgi:polysaccharide biosynthesis transport protein
MLMVNRASTVAAAELPQIAHGFDLRQAVNFAWRQWKLIAAVMTAALLIGAAYLAVQVRLYTATTLILLDPRKEKATGADAILSEVNLDLATVESQIAIIRSSSLLRRVVEKENLVKDPEFGFPASAQEPAMSEAT